MKNTTYQNVLFLFCFLLILQTFSCGSLRENQNSSTNQKTESQIKVGDCEWHLKHRISDCDSAIVFMNQVILPVKVNTFPDELYPVQKMVRITIPGEEKAFWKTEKYHFYINPDCLVGLDAERVFEIFITKDWIVNFKKFNDLYNEKQLEWNLQISATNDFVMGISIKNGKVIRASVAGGVSQSHLNKK